MAKQLTLEDIMPKLKQQVAEMKSVEEGKNTEAAFVRRWKVTPEQMRANLQKAQEILFGGVK